MGLNYRAISKYMGTIFCLLGIVMVPSVIVGLIYSELYQVRIFAEVIVISVAVGLILLATQRHYTITRRVNIREGYFIVAIAWIVFIAMGSLPFYLSGAIPSYIDAIFETCSGLSTTGASVINDVEILPYSILFWRSFTHWLGGMGILVFALAFIPDLSTRTQSIAYAETTGPSVQKLSPHSSDTSRILYALYTAFTVIEIIALKLAGMNWFESCIHAFGAVGTGGFSCYNDSIMHFDSTTVYILITIFMFASGVSFNLYFVALKNGIHSFARDGEFKFYLTITIVTIVLIATTLYGSGTYDSLSESSVLSAFQVVSVLTTTGFATTDYSLWPTFACTMLFVLFFIGGCTASTSGGPKTMRVLMMLKLVKRSMSVRLHPHAVVEIKMNGKKVQADTVSGVVNFTFLYIIIFFAGALLVSVDNFDFITSMSASAACIGNIGPGFAAVGPMANYSIFSWFSKLILSVLMVVGRLELFTILVLFSPKFWNINKS